MVAEATATSWLFLRDCEGYDYLIPENEAQEFTDMDLEISEVLQCQVRYLNHPQLWEDFDSKFGVYRLGELIT